jgi:glycerol-3-phosphate dehydrogenase
MIRQLIETEAWDIVIIGGGATGLGTAVDAASRGYKTLLLEQHDFAKGTSSRSTKLIHGGVRYLAMGNIKLVIESLKERGLLLKHAPHLAANISFVLPCYSGWQKIYYGTGLKLYDLMAGKWGLGKTKFLSAKETLALLPTLNKKKLKGGIEYRDGQFDDARLAINLAQTAAAYGATLINYCRVISLVKKENKIAGVKFNDSIDEKIIEVKCKSVINATGVFTDDILQLDVAGAKKIIQPSQGIHLVFDKKYFPGEAAMMIPKTTDGRVLFAVPWHNRVIVGTTDTEIDRTAIEPKPLPEEVDFILQHLNRYLNITVTQKDVCSSFAGLRPLVKTGTSQKTAFVSRSHTLMVSNSGLVTVTGGKWTTYRKMAEEAVNNAVFSANLNKLACITGNLKIHGWKSETDISDPLHIYGSDAAQIREIAEEAENFKQRIHPRQPNIQAEIIWAVRHEMAMEVEDVLARRTRILYLDARAALEAAPLVATVMATELKKDQNWVQQQIIAFTAVAKQYVLS